MSRAEEYERRMRALGYKNSLTGMDDEDIEWELEKMDRSGIEPPAPQFGRTYRPPDRDFAERMFKMFARPFDPNWKMPDMDGPEFRQNRQPDMRSSALGLVWPGGDGAESMLRRMSYNLGGGENGQSEVMKAKGKYDVPVQIAGETVKEYISAGEFAAEVEKEALAQGDSPELARKKGEDAFALYGIYSVGAASGAVGVGSVSGIGAGTGVGVVGSVVGSKVIKPWIKKQVLEKTEEDYNKPLFPGTNPPGPG